MKRTERHHLKENELVAFVEQARRVIGEQQRSIGAILLAVLVVGGGVAGYFAWRNHTQNSAAAMLAEAIRVEEASIGPPPAGAPPGGQWFASERERAEAAATKLKAVADQYPSTEAGKLARYQEASVYLILGRPKEAAAAFQQVIDLDTGLLGQSARLGLAEAHAQAGEYDQAISAFQEAANRTDGQLPVDGILMQLARTYRSAGKMNEAQQTFTRIVDEFPASPLRAEAQRELDLLKEG